MKLPPLEQSPEAMALLLLMVRLGAILANLEMVVFLRKLRGVLLPLNGEVLTSTLTQMHRQLLQVLPLSMKM